MLKGDRRGATIRWLFCRPATVVLLFAISASAHHSMTGYDRSHTITLRATITDFNWTNPHVEIYFQVSQVSGTIEKWMAEMPSRTGLSGTDGVKKR